MKKLIATLILAGTAVAAFASCPSGMPYRCIPGPGGKMICGCGV